MTEVHHEMQAPLAMLYDALVECSETARERLPNQEAVQLALDEAWAAFQALTEASGV